jgi:hypothetical protein
VYGALKLILTILTAQVTSRKALGSQENLGCSHREHCWIVKLIFNYYAEIVYTQ